MNDDKHTIKSGHLDVGDGHKIYYQQWGNPEASPVFVFHGGPASSSKPHHKLAFDPQRHQVIFHDQRGCGQSLYENQLHETNTQKLIQDIDKLRVKLGFNKIHIYGHSWGSTLGAYYAIKHPEKVEKMLLGGIYTGSQKETYHLFKGGLKTYFPEAWQRFIEQVPTKERNNIFEWYEKALTTGSDEERLEQHKRWSQLESSAMSIDPDYKKNRMHIDSLDALDEDSLKLDLLGIHYFKNDCFLPERYILDNAHKISGIETIIINGYHDTVCPPDTAYELAQNIGSSCHLHLVPGSHKPEGALREVQRAYAWIFLV
jgi:proline iminopeptidase